MTAREELRDGDLFSSVKDNRHEASEADMRVPLSDRRTSSENSGKKSPRLETGRRHRFGSTPFYFLFILISFYFGPKAHDKYLRDSARNNRTVGLGIISLQ